MYALCKLLLCMHYTDSPFMHYTDSPFMHCTNFSFLCTMQTCMHCANFWFVCTLQVSHVLHPASFSFVCTLQTSPLYALCKLLVVYIWKLLIIMYSWKLLTVRYLICKPVGVHSKNSLVFTLQTCPWFAFYEVSFLGSLQASPYCRGSLYKFICMHQYQT